MGAVERHRRRRSRDRSGSTVGRWSEVLGQQVVRIRSAPRARKGQLLAHLLAGIVLVGVGALISSWIHVQSFALRYRVTQLHREQESLIQSRDALEIERQMLRSPGRVTWIAEEQLGMRLPEPGERVVLR